MSASLFRSGALSISKNDFGDVARGGPPALQELALQRIVPKLVFLPNVDSHRRRVTYCVPKILAYHHRAWTEGFEGYTS